MPRISRRHLLAASFVGLTLTALPAAAQTGRGTAATPPTARGATAAAELSSAIEATARLVGPSVVEIFTTSYAAGDGVVPRSADLVTTTRSSGSGVIVDPNGFIITNAHVIRGAQRLYVELSRPGTGSSILGARGRSLIGQVVGLDLETDLAVVKVEAQGLPTLSLADSDDLQPGQIVLACGSPLGLQNSVSLGVVSAVARQLEPESPMIYVQTDASINPGSSGGPLVDLRGRVVGINTLKVTRSAGDEGLGFAAPSNIVRTVYEQIRKSGRVRRGEIGIKAQTVTPVMAAGLGLARDHGVVLADVRPGSMAAKAGLQRGDLVTALDGKPMENGRQLQVSLYRHVVGDVVTLEILRDGQAMKMPVAMAERQDALDGLADANDVRQNLVPRLGVLGLTVDAQVAEVLPWLRVRSGVVVVSLAGGAIDARDGGLAPGDVVFTINKTPVSGLTELRRALDALQTGDPVVLGIDRRGELLYLAFTVE
jgi:serine protease Do